MKNVVARFQICTIWHWANISQIFLDKYSGRIFSRDGIVRAILNGISNSLERVGEVYQLLGVKSECTNVRHAHRINFIMGEEEEEGVKITFLEVGI